MRLELGNKMLSEHIREGQDIFFSCLVEAQPAVQEITWLHNERPINETAPSEPNAGGPQGGRPNEPVGRASASPDSTSPAGSGGARAAPRGRLIVSNNSLVLQRVQIDQRGLYACMAANSEGVGLSNKIDLRVLRKSSNNI